MENATSFTSYQSMMAQVTTGLSELEKLCDRMSLDENRKALAKSREKLSHHKFAVGVMGEFKRGKSTVINSLLEKEVMPADILPCSATMNRVTYDMQPHVELQMRDGSVRQISVDELGAYVTKLTSENETRAAEVDEAIVYYPCRFCQNGVDIVDTPGLNDDERMNRISEEVIPKLDAVIMVITPDNPFSMSEAEFVRSKLMTSDLSRMIFLVNKIDQVRRVQDRERVVEGIREKIKSSVLEKTAELYGENSDEYNNTKQKIGKIRVYPISALDALDGKTAGDQQLVEQSGTLVFEEALTKMLTEERGALELGGPLNVIQRTAGEVAKVAVTRKNALELSAEEFEKCQQESLQQVREIRERKQAEKKRLSANAAKASRQLEGEIIGFYPEIKKRLLDKVDTAASGIDVTTLTNAAGQEAAAEKMQKEVSAEMESAMALITERIQLHLGEIIGQEMISVGKFMSDAMDKIDGIKLDMNKKKGGFDSSELMAYGVDALFGGFGIGGIVAGYKNAGFKGAFVGGMSSYAATFATAFLLASASVTALPLVLISVAAGTLSGKFLTGAMFKKDVGQKKLDEIRQSLKNSINGMIAEMQTQKELERWAYEVAGNRFDELIESMEAECEKLLQDSESSMDAIKRDLTENAMQRKQVEEECDQVIHSVERIVKELEPITRKVCQVLESA